MTTLTLPRLRVTPEPVQPPAVRVVDLRRHPCSLCEREMSECAACPTMRAATNLKPL